MGVEIERKYLVTSAAWRGAATGSALLRQGYLSSNAKATVRVRTWDDRRAVLTLKGAAEGISRAEYEYEIPIGEARELLAMAFWRAGVGSGRIFRPPSGTGAGRGGTGR
jgi:adenylate cyclase